MRTLLVSLLLSFLPSSMLLAQWSPELPVTVPTLGPAALTQHTPGAASDGESWFVAWSHSILSHLPDTGENVVGLRLASDGSRTSAIPTILGSGRAPAVVWNGDRYFVAWRSGYGDIEGRWVSRDGEPIGSPIRLAGDSYGVAPSLASNGSEVVVVGASSAVILRRDGSYVPVPSWKIGLLIWGVASDGESFLLHGQPLQGGFGALATARLSPSGEVVPAHTGTPFTGSRIVWGGEHYLLTGETTDGEKRQPALVRISRSGEPIGEPLRVPVEGNASFQSLAALGDGGALLALQTYTGGLAGPFRLFRIGSGNEVVEMGGERMGTGPHLAGSGGSILLLWNGGEAILHQRLTSAGSPLDDPQVTALSARDQIRPAVAATAAGFIAAWEERGEMFDPLRPSRVMIAPLGSRSSRAGVSVSPSSGQQMDPALASNGEVVLVVWIEDGQLVKGRRFTPRGNALDPAPLDLGNASGYPGLVPASRLSAFWSGNQFLVAFSADAGLRYVRVTSDGILLDAEPIAVPQAERPPGFIHPPWLYEPVFASAGDRILLVWQSSSRSIGSVTIPGAPMPPPPRIEAVRLDAGGMLLDSSPLLITTAAGWGQVLPRVASNGSTFFVVWDELGVVRGASVSIDGDVQLRSGVDVYGGLEGFTRAGEEFLLLVRDSDGRLHGHRVSPEGVVRSAFPLSSREVWLGTPHGIDPSSALTTSDSGSMALVFSSFSEEAGAVRRIFYRATELEETPRRRPIGRR